MRPRIAGDRAAARSLRHDRPRHGRALRRVDRGLGRAPPRGRGGTGEVVQFAITEGTGRSLAPDPPHAGRLLWSAFDPAVLTRSRTTRRPNARLEIGHLGRLRGPLMPPPDDAGARLPGAFHARTLRRIRRASNIRCCLRRRASRGLAPKISPRNCRGEIETNGERYRRDCTGAHEISAPIDLLEQAYSWATGSRPISPKLIRSGHIFNSSSAAIAVCLGLSAFMAPRSSSIRRGRVRDHRRDHPQRDDRHIATNGTGAGSIIASSPSGCGRCAA